MYSYKCEHLNVVGFVLPWATEHWNGYGSHRFLFGRMCFCVTICTTACFVVSGGFLVCVGIVFWSSAVVHSLHFDSCAWLMVAVCLVSARNGC